MPHIQIYKRQQELCQNSPNRALFYPTEHRHNLFRTEYFFVNYILLSDRQRHKSPTETGWVERKNRTLLLELTFLFQIMRKRNPEGLFGKKQLQVHMKNFVPEWDKF